jgi:O-antigen ligase
VTGTIAPFLVGSAGAMGVFTLALIMMYMSRSFLEMFLGFIFMLVLSDNLSEHFEFAKTYKNVYISMLFLILLIHPRDFIIHGKLIAGFLPFFGIAIFALQYSGETGVAIQKTISYILLLILVPSYMVYFFKTEGIVFLRKMIFFFTLIILVGYLLRLVFPEFGSIEGGRLRGFFGNPNGLGIFLFLFFVFFYTISDFYPNLFSNIEYRFVFFTILFALVLTGSRSALVSVLMVMLFKRLQYASAFLSFIMFVAIIVSYQIITVNIVDIVKFMGLETYFRVNTLEEGSGRFIAWRFAWMKIQGFYYVGGGFGNDEYIMRQNYRELAILGHQGGVHNSYLTFWFDTGLLGLIFYFFNFIRIFINGVKKNKLAVPCLYAVLFSITYESWLAGSLNPFTIILLLTISLFICPEFSPEEEQVPNNITVDESMV